ncbi:MAG: helix-turn-helix transcriptional regulator [Candidatus Nanopelagicales bacterium]
MVRTSQRAQVLEVLRRATGPMSIMDISDQVGRHPNTVRFHLKAMVANRQVDRVEVTDRSPGRPPQMFTLAKGMDPTGPRHYRMLAEVLAETLAREPNARARAALAGREWGRRLGQDQKSERVPGNQSRKPVTRLVQLLDEMGFAPQARRRNGELQIGLRQCPFLELASEHPGVVCPIHLGLMQGALEAEDSIVTVTKLEPFAELDLCIAHLMTKGAA